MEIDLSIPGAKEERAKLKQLQEQLNQEGIVPEQAYRMSKVDYSLVSFVNNIIGLHLSKNYEVIPVFIARAHRHMMQFGPSPSAKAYYDLVSAYLRQMAHVLDSFTSVSDESLALIPDEIRRTGNLSASRPASEHGHG